eukprot:TRINITY_DN30757_c0_g1_i1.p1 TRINITY_DN30757_c0_g1~~TRINITY_DN30757_c0_g1_i1.p1  ORF type:complete len:624 (-),score=124.04 TRINITY_DN30757_c0_g1_i1:3-1874(-)
MTSRKAMKKMLNEAYTQQYLGAQAGSEDDEPMAAPAVSKNRFEVTINTVKPKNKKSKKKATKAEEEVGELNAPDSVSGPPPAPPQPVPQPEEEDDSWLADDIPDPVQPQQSKKAKKNKKKVEEELDDDALLDAIVAAPVVTAVSEKPRDQFLSLLACVPKCFNPDNELRSLFGRGVTERKRADPRKSARKTTFRRSTLVLPQEDRWPPFNGLGLCLKQVQTDEGVPVFRYEHNAEYKRAETAFQSAAATHNHQNLFAVHARFPYHVTTLLQICQVFQHTGEPIRATEFLCQAIYALEVAAAGFPWLRPTERLLPYKFEENRPLFIALDHYAHSLAKRGCHRSALEFCKLLFSLDPEADPMFCLLKIDYFAIRSSQWKFLAHLFSGLEKHEPMLAQLPNMMYSRALVNYLQEVSDIGGGAEEYKGDAYHEVSSSQLCDAVLLHPWLLVMLLDKCGIVNEDAMTHSFFTAVCESPGFRQLFELYVERTWELWKRKDMTTWLQSVIGKTMMRLVRDRTLRQQLDDKRKRLYYCPMVQQYLRATSSEVVGTVDVVPQEEANDELQELMQRLQAGEGPPEALHTDQAPILTFLQSFLPWNTASAIARRGAHDDYAGEEFEEDMDVPDD